MQSKYIVGGILPSGENLGTFYQGDSPQQAILSWYSHNRKYPSCVCIQAASKADCRALLQWAHDHLEMVKVEHDKGCIYKWDYISDRINKGLESDCSGFQWEYDMVEPFTAG